MMSMNKHKNQSVIQKLRNREVLGLFTNSHSFPSVGAKLLFGCIPSRLRFHLKNVIKDMGKHILMGMTQCGQFILTYTFTMDQIQSNNRVIYGASCFKYQLHWWKFRVNSPATRIAVVRLFENQDIQDVLTIGIAQWPTVSNKILVYGQSCAALREGDASEFRKIYITITVNPSLSNCEDCINAENPLSEEILEDWNSKFSGRCLRHGLTMHTMLSVFPPFPAINLSIALKDENRIIVNTGNSFHVLFVDLEESNGDGNDSSQSEETIVNEKLRHRLGIKLALKGLDYKIPRFSENPNDQMLNNPKKRTISRSKTNKMMSCFVNSDCDNQCENCKSDCDDCITFHCTKRTKCSPVPLAITKQAWLRQVANQVYDFAEPDESCNLKFKWYRRRTIADKMYEFCSEDEEDTENIHPLSLHFGTRRSLGILRTTAAVRKEYSLPSGRKPCEMNSEDGDRVSVTSQTSDISDIAESHLPAMSPVSLSNLESNSNIPNRDRFRFCENENENFSIINVNQSKTNYSKVAGGSSQLSVTCDSICLEWETTSLSPRSDISHTTASSECSEFKLDSTRSFRDNLSTVDSSESHSSKAVKCYPDCTTTEKDRTKSKDSPALNKFFVQENKIGSFRRLRNHRSKCLINGKDSKKGFSQTNPFKRYGCDVTHNRYLVPYVSTRFEKRYIEMDEEILSTITDIDDEDDVNYALPSYVYGSGYCQMHRIAGNRVERLSVPSCLIRQDSLDIEQFSYKIAVIICKCQGYKFWFCSDYDVEIVDVCPLNGDVLAVVLLRINADPPPDKTDQGNSMAPIFNTRCLFIWNAKTRACWLEAYTPLVRKDTKSQDSARMEAQKLRSLGLGFFDVPLIRPVRYFEHLILDNIRFGPSMEIIEDELNMIAFFRDPDDMVLDVADDSDHDSLYYSEGQASVNDEENYDS